MLSRLDILIYAHDGRGLGHASRSIAIGMALRRLYPDLKVLFISGTGFTSELIDSAPLDWLKLPAYATRIINGKSRGIDGASNFNDQELGEYRALSIKQVVEMYRPRVVLCDHSPLGKHKELLPALQSAKNTQWILGTRGVIGAVPQVFSKPAIVTFQKYFKTILWYGDSKVLGDAAINDLGKRFSCTPIECGYVSRLSELSHGQGKKSDNTKKYAGIVSIPWLGEQTSEVVFNLAKALKNIGPEHGPWKLFLGSENKHQDQNPGHLLKGLSHVSLEPPGNQYAQVLPRSKIACIYGGYNSITDVLSLNIPAVVLLRSLQDEEQQLHMQRLVQHTGKQLQTLSEQEATTTALENAFRRQLAVTREVTSIRLNGAEAAARHLAQQAGLSR